MKYVKRRDFIRHSAFTCMAIAGRYAFAFNSPAFAKLSFSTLGCPKWDLPEIVNFAANHAYKGIEIRVIAGELNLPQCPHFSAGKLNATKRLISDKNLTIVSIGSSAQLHHSNKADLDKNLDEGKRFIDLAGKLDCKHVRVFPEKLLPGEERKRSLDTIVKNFRLLGDYAKGSNVKVLLESHGDLIEMNELYFVMSNVGSANTGMVWDILNMWSVTRQPVSEVFRKLHEYIFHVHIKDAKWMNNQEKYVLLGKGDAPIKEAVKALYKSGYEGYYSYEWEKLWHPELEEPEIALALYPPEMNKYFNSFD